MKFTAAGDALIQRRIQNDYPGFEELTPYIMQGDARFFNLETTLNREGEVCGNQYSGGTYVRTNPEVLEDLYKLGFNMTSFNNNHALDFSYRGLESTIKALEESDFVHAGVGRNLAMASAPRYLDTESGRVALIAVNTSFHASMMAGNENGRFPGRPGINGICVSEQLTVNREELEVIKSIAKKMNINATNEIDRAEGYLPPLPDGIAEFGNLNFYLGEETAHEYIVNQIDMDRVAKSIYEAKFQADYVMLSIHSHEIEGTSKENIPDFLVDIAHKFIDLGADAIVGHGPHLLRAIEVYNNKPIFYSLGDLILELYSVEAAPAPFFEKHGIDRDETVHALLKHRSRNFTVGLMEDKTMMETIIPYWETDENNNLTSLKFMPVEITMNGNKSQIGLPRKAKDLTLVKRLADLSKPYGVTMQIEEDGTVTCKW